MRATGARVTLPHAGGKGGNFFQFAKHALHFAAKMFLFHYKPEMSIEQEARFFFPHAGSIDRFGFSISATQSRRGSGRRMR